MGVATLFGFCLLSCGTNAAPMAEAPLAVLSTGSASFAAAVVGSSAPESAVTLSNTGGKTLSLGPVQLSDTQNFSVAATCGASLGAGQSCTFSLSFHPLAAVTSTATLTLTDDSGGQPGTQQVVTLTGTGMAAPEPLATLTPISMSFGSETQDTSSAPQVVTLTNAGTAPLTIAGAVLSDTADFSMTTSCGATLPAAASCSWSIRFQPQAVGAVTGSLTVSDNSGGSAVQQTVALSGTGVPVPLAQATIAPASLSFASTDVGAAAAAQAITVSNTGTAPLLLAGVAVGDNADYGVTNGCGSTVAVGGSCQLSVVFHPQHPGTLTSSLTLTDNSGVGSGSVQQVIPLTASGLAVSVAQAGLTPPSLTFGSVQVGTTGTAQAITLSNSGTGPLTLANVVLSDPVDFSLTNPCGMTLAVAASCSLSVGFQPQKAGALSATLTVVDNSGGTNAAQQVVMLSGTGTALPPAPQVSLSPAVLSFADTMVTTQTAARGVTLSNTGNAPLTVSSVALSDTQDFSLSSSCPGTLAPGASCALAVIFEPQSVAAQHATLMLTDDSGAIGGTVQQTVAITGNGVPFAGPRAAIAPASLSFPQTVTNAGAAPESVTLSNTGTTALTVASVTLGGANASAFAIVNGSCSGALAVGSSCVETVVYQPKLASAGDAASLVIADDGKGPLGATQTVALTGSAIAEVDSVASFGDSITCGYFAQPHDGTGLVYSLEGYAGLFDTYLGVPASNFCRVGDTAADLSRQWVPFHSSPTGKGNQLYTLMIGTNDAYRYSVGQNSLDTYTAEVSAALAWLTLPDTDKVLANTIVQQTGNWTADVGFGLVSSDAGASLSFAVNQAVAGRDLYVVYHVWAQPLGQAGKASILVDGVVQATVDESQGSLVNLPTENGTSDTYLAATIPLGAAGPHTVTFQSVGPSGSAVGLLWAGVAQQDYHQVDGSPRVLLGLITNSPSGNQTYVADVYNLQLKALVPALNADGMNVALVLTDRVLDPAADFADILHPNNAGHTKLAAAFEKAR